MNRFAISPVRTSPHGGLLQFAHIVCLVVDIEGLLCDENDFGPCRIEGLRAVNRRYAKRYVKRTVKLYVLARPHLIIQIGAYLIKEGTNLYAPSY